MPKQARITNIIRRGQRATLVRWRGGGRKNEIEIPGGMDEFRQWIREQLREDEDMLVVLALAQWLAKNPNSTDFTGIEGKQLTLDLSASATTGIVTVV